MWICLLRSHVPHVNMCIIDLFYWSASWLLRLTLETHCKHTATRCNTLQHAAISSMDQQAHCWEFLTFEKASQCVAVCCSAWQCVCSVFLESVSTVSSHFWESLSQQASPWGKKKKSKTSDSKQIWICSQSLWMCIVHMYVSYTCIKFVTNLYRTHV